MLRICSWCRWPLGIKPGRPGVTHGICAPCAGRHFRLQRCPSTAWQARLARGIEAAADAAAWVAVVSAYLVLASAFGAAVLAAMAAEAGGGETVVATAYSWREPAHRKWGDKNAIGSSLQRHVEGLPQIAVDPRRIPLGSIVRVDGLGKRIATDTGGLIKGSKIDIHWQSVAEMRAWGKRRVEIEVVRRGWGAGTKAAQREGHRRAAAREISRRDAAPPPARERLYVMAWDSKGRRG